MKIQSIPKSGREGDLAFVKGRYGNVARPFVPPSNPRTEMHLARFGIPKPGTAVWIRTCQHIDGFMDVPKLLRFRIPASTV
jgi:hypothetical protein